MGIQTDQQVNHNRPDIVLHDKKKNDISCPFDGRVIEREEEKREKYEDLRRSSNNMECQESSDNTNHNRGCRYTEQNL